MNNTKWLNGMHQSDTLAPASSTEGEAVYTLFMRDFLSMPNVDFSAVSEMDQSVRALLN